VKGVQTPYARPGSQTRKQLIEGYLPLVKHVLGRLAISLPPGWDRDDLYSVGVCGLIHAADTFDPTKGATFKTFAYSAIRGAILDELRRNDIVPRSRREKLKNLERAAAAVKERLGRDGTPEELAEELGVPVEKVERDLLALHTVSLISLEEEQGEDGSLKQMLQAPEAKDPMDEASFREEVERLGKAIGELPENERKVVILYYHEELLLREIGEILGVSESRVSQILTRAHHHLRRILKEKEEEG